MRRASWRPSLAELLALAIAITAARCSTGQFSDALGQRSGWCVCSWARGPTVACLLPLACIAGQPVPLALARRRVEAPTSLLAEGGNQATQVNVTLLPEHVSAGRRGSAARRGILSTVSRWCSAAANNTLTGAGPVVGGLEAGVGQAVPHARPGVGG